MRKSVARIFAAVCAVFVVLGGLTVGAAAYAIPATGAGPDTAGTSSQVWPTSVSPGERLNFEVSGYPAGETLNIKIDDGMACSDTSHGACVYAQVKIGSNGSATGSIVVPNLPNGGHWLRMLATGDRVDAKTGEVVEGEYLGYTRRGGNDFTVAGSTATDNSAAVGSINAGPSAGSSSTSETIEGGELSIDIDDEEEEAPAAVEEIVTADDEVLVAEGSGAVVGPVEEESGSSIPVVGIAVLGGALVIGAGVVLWALLRRRKLAAQAAAAASIAAAEVETPTETHV